MQRQLPARPDLDQLNNEAKTLLKAHKAGDPTAITRIREGHPKFARLADQEIASARINLRSIQLVIAREYGFAAWTKLKVHVDSRAPETSDPANELVAPFKRTIPKSSAGCSKAIPSWRAGSTTRSDRSIHPSSTAPAAAR